MPAKKTARKRTPRGLSPKTLDILRAVKKRIMAEPASLRMEDWVIPGNTDLRDETDDSFCGTTACIGGHAVLAAGMLRAKLPKDASVDETSSWTRKAKRELQFREVDGWLLGGAEALMRQTMDLTPSQADRLFHVEGWPRLHRHAYEQARSPEHRAVSTLARIDHFIATSGRE